MKKILTAIMLMTASAVSAQTLPVQAVEGGIYGGFTVPVDKYQDYTNKIGYGLGVEIRYNFNGTPWDCGLMADFTRVNHDYVPHGWNESALWTEHKDTWDIAAVGDYNFRQGTAINPFVGCGIGVAFNSTHGDVMRDVSGTSVLFVPRIGVELVHHIRITASCHISRKGFNTFDLTIGFVLGGRPKK